MVLKGVVCSQQWLGTIILCTWIHWLKWELTLRGNTGTTECISKIYTVILKGAAVGPLDWEKIHTALNASNIKLPFSWASHLCQRGGSFLSLSDPALMTMHSKSLVNLQSRCRQFMSPQAQRDLHTHITHTQAFQHIDDLTIELGEIVHQVWVGDLLL